MKEAQRGTGIGETPLRGTPHGTSKASETPECRHTYEDSYILTCTRTASVHAQRGQRRSSQRLLWPREPSPPSGPPSPPSHLKPCCDTLIPAAPGHQPAETRHSSLGASRGPKLVSLFSSPLQWGGFIHVCDCSIPPHSGTAHNTPQATQKNTRFSVFLCIFSNSFLDRSCLWVMDIV